LVPPPRFEVHPVGRAGAVADWKFSLSRVYGVPGVPLSNRNSRAAVPWADVTSSSRSIGVPGTNDDPSVIAYGDVLVWVSVGARSGYDEFAVPTLTPAVRELRVPVIPVIVVAPAVGLAT
jgi:hypothetical protein